VKVHAWHFAACFEKEKPDWVWVNYYDYFAVSAAVHWNAKENGDVRQSVSSSERF